MGCADPIWPTTLGEVSAVARGVREGLRGNLAQGGVQTGRNTVDRLFRPGGARYVRVTVRRAVRPAPATAPSRNIHDPTPVRRPFPTPSRTSIRTTWRSIALAVGAVATATLVVSAAGTPSADALDNTPWTLPAPPPKCTAAQADAGNVAGCIVAFYDDPSTTGFGVPPAPGVGTGWVWSGYRYNGSPALADWEATWIQESTEAIGGVPAGALETHKYARPLFEGFLNEIVANGYRVREASGYGFRCTAGSGGWQCPSGDPDDLSNHAWGLAIDFNSAANPIRSYTSENGQTACLTPIVTDLPRWVIQTAEKWGLYWGGYGWNSGCPDARDPAHRRVPRPTPLRVPWHARAGRCGRRVQHGQQPERVLP